MKINHLKLIPIISVGLLASNNTVASTAISNIYISGNDEGGSLPPYCYQRESTSTSCNTKSFHKDSDGNYAVIEGYAQSEVEGTSLKTKSGLSSDIKTEAEMLTYIEENFAPKTESEYQSLIESRPFLFIDGVFSAERYLLFDANSFAEQSSSQATARWTDDWLITGEEDGTYGTLSLYYSYEGVITDDEMYYENGITDYIGVGSFAVLELENTTTEESDRFISYEAGVVDELLELSLTFVFGEEFGVSLTSTSYSYIDHDPYLTEVFSINDVSTTSDFFNTAVFEDIVVRDSYGNILDNYGLQSSSGFSDFESVYQDDGSDDGNNGSVDIPEPPLMALLAISAIFTLRRRHTKSI